MKQFTRWFLAALVAGAMFIVPRASAQNLILNPGFETGVFGPNWSQTAPGWNPGNWAIDTTNPHSGLGSAHNFFDGGTWQTMGGLTGGSTYHFTGWEFLQSGGDLLANGNANGWGSFFQFQFLTAGGTPIGGQTTISVQDTLPRDQWNQSTRDLLAPATATQLRFLFGTFTSNINPIDPSQGVHTVAQSWWDDMSLTLVAVPEPGTYGMLALGLGMMIPVIRRRIKA